MLTTLSIRRLCTLIVAATILPSLASGSTEKPDPIELGYASGTVVIAPNGSLQIVKASGDCELGLSLDYYAPGWRRHSQSSTGPVDGASDDPNAWTWRGQFEQNGKVMTYEQTVRDHTDRVEVEYRLVRSEGFAVQEQSRGPFVSVQFPGECFEDRNIMIGNRTITLPISNIWGNGNKVVVPGMDSELKLSDWTVISVWNTRSGREARLQAVPQGPRSESGPTEYLLSVSIEKQVTEVSEEPVEKVLSIKLRSYPRILERATMAGVQTALPASWLSEAANAFDNDDESEAKFLVNKAEDWFDAQGRVYDVSDRITHLKLFHRIREGAVDEALPTLLSDAVAALNEGEMERSIELTTQARELLDTAEAAIREQHGHSYYPAGDYSPFSWLKAFDMLGYVGPSDNLTPGEPYPNAITWPSGGRGVEDFTMSLVPAGGPARKDFEVERSWVRNTWRSPEGPSYTFTVLTPLIAVDGIQNLPIQGLPSTPEIVEWSSVDGEIRSQDFDDAGSEGIAPDEMSEGWLWLRGSRFAMLLFPSQPVAELRRMDHGVHLRLQESGSVSLMLIPNHWTRAMVEEEASFWAGVAAKAPEDVVEIFENGTVTHRYLYTERPNVWGTAAKSIAPVPPLTVMHREGDWSQSLVPTSAGSFRYVPGDRLDVELPGIEHPQLRGINEYLARLSEDRVADFAAMGADWVRICFGTKDFKDRPEAAYEMLGVVLERLSRHGMKALVDPHDFQFQVHDWDKGIPTDPAKRQPFLDLWKNLAEVSVNYPEVVVGYDLYNELRVRNNGWPSWDKLAKEAIDVIRPIDPKTPIYISGVDMSNPSGYLHAEPIDRNNLIYSYHFYAPHAFSHQKIFRASTNDAFVFYPGWIPQIDWKNDLVYGKADLQWWDRWMIAASMRPVLEFAAEHDVPFHCGEVAPIGYSRKKASDASGLWIRDALDTIEQYGFSWHLWNQGFGLVIEPVAEEVERRWADDNHWPLD